MYQIKECANEECANEGGVNCFPSLQSLRNDRFELRNLNINITLTVS